MPELQSWCDRPRCTNHVNNAFRGGWCDSCLTNCFRCPCPCNRAITRTRGRRMPDGGAGNGTLVCPTYYRNNVSICGACEQPVLTRMTLTCSCGQERVCQHCRRSSHAHPRPQIHNYAYKPTPNFLGSGTKLFLGVELEVDYGSMTDNQLRDLWAMSDNEQLFYLKHDSSLNSGFELVTHPATLDYHRRKFPWGGRRDRLTEKQSVLQTIRDYGYQSHRTTTCGLHIHASKAGLGRNNQEIDQTLNKLLILFGQHWKEIATFSRRTPDNLSRWARPNHIDAGLEIPLLKKLNGMKIASHSRAINTGPRDTIEFRLFRGTLERMVLLAALEFVQTMVDLAKNNGTSWAYNSGWDDIVTAGSQYLGLSMYFKRMAEREAKLAVQSALTQKEG